MVFFFVCRQTITGGGGGGYKRQFTVTYQQKKKKFQFLIAIVTQKTSNRRIRTDFDSQAEELQSDKLKINGN